MNEEENRKQIVSLGKEKTCEWRLAKFRNESERNAAETKMGVGLPNIRLLPMILSSAQTSSPSVVCYMLRDKELYGKTNIPDMIKSQM